jgi:hypothetical protein
MLYRYLCFPAVVAALLLGSCGEQTEGQSGVLKRFITNGTPDTSQAHMAVVGVQTGGGSCSGTLIHDRVVLTAAHCVVGASASAVRVGFGNNINLGGGASWVGVSEVWVHPLYVGTQQDAAHDIALVRLSKLPPVVVTPIPALPYGLRLVDPDDKGIPLEFVGFGRTETNGFGIKLTVTDGLEWICERSSGCWINSQMGWFAFPYTICTDLDPGGPCGGDSGGPAFIWRNGKEYVAGVVSYGVDEACTGFGCNTKIDEFESELSDFIGGVNGATCFSGDECDSGICSDGVCCNIDCTGECNFCNLSTSLGTCATAPNGYECPDSDKCNGTETCQDGECIDDDSPTDCNDSNVCTVDTCDPSIGCVRTPVANGTSCSDGDICNGTEACQGGLCRSPGGLDCNDVNPCTNDSCHPVTGCSNTQLSDGTSCDDNNACNGEDVCQGGVCVSGSGLDCDDNNSCTDDQCIPGTGCVHSPYSPGTPCDDDNVCTLDETCTGGVCTGQAADCDDHNPCTDDSCDPIEGCRHLTLPDGTGCGGGMCGQAVCAQGVCQSMDSTSCDDHDSCTNDWCDPQQGCMHDSLPDGYECGECYLCLGGECLKANDCGDDTGGCGCGHLGGEFPAWIGLSILAAPIFRRRR